MRDEWTKASSSAAARGMTRRHALGVLSASVLAGCSRDAPPVPSAGDAGPAAPPALPGRPHIVMFVADTLRADTLGCYGAKVKATPRIDALAAGGILCTRAYANAPWTLPSHASLFTGFPPEIHGQTHAAVTMAGGAVGVKAEAALPGRFTTLAAALKEIGYQTAGLSQNLWVGPLSTQDHGFDRFVELREEKTPLYVEAPGGGREHKVTHFTRRFLAEARDPSRPLFLFINNMTCHLPYDPPPYLRQRFFQGMPSDLEKLARVKSNTWLTMVQNGELDEDAMWHLRDLYQGSVAELDAVAGGVLDVLDGAGLLDTTLFVFLSDHGECIGHHGFYDHLFNLYDDLVRVPLILSHPALAGGQVREDLVQLSDLFPTILRALGQERILARLALPGQVLPLVPGAPPADGPLFMLFLRGSRVLEGLRAELAPATVARLDRDLFGVIEGTHKLVLAHDGEALLFDLAADPGEERNLAQDAPQMVESMAELLRAAYGTRGYAVPVL